ncbi:hypothetical protein BC938DRAFT_471131 [Jimgerdemannia flammicorona]|uniref:Uncharacterized protein n=1 Tax=Jimgerdemannia flammicorona TaxID=994334 RepID=A0A433QUS1_9FUNG|nr:hypothetical protein BC938DRAFT_471131 [Jimgerdemannia flammicorona]
MGFIRTSDTGRKQRKHPTSCRAQFLNREGYIKLQHHDAGRNIRASPIFLLYVNIQAIYPSRIQTKTRKTTKYAQIRTILGDIASPLYTASMLAHRAHFYIVITFTPEILPDESDNRLTIYCFLYLCILQPYHHRDEESEGEKK